MTEAGARVSSCLKRPDGVRRLGQALWMMIGQSVEQDALLWARGLLGVNGDALLWRALYEEGALREPDFVLRPRQLAHFLCALWGEEQDTEQSIGLIWTFPENLVVGGIAGDSYLRAAAELVESSDATLTIVAPYLEPKGMGRLHHSLIEALHRGVVVRVLTHDAEDLSSLASASLEALRRDSAGLSGSLTVFTASTTPPVLLHLKIIIADERKAIVGSANVTSNGFGANLEAGVVLGQAAAIEIEKVIQATVTKGLVRRVFSTEI